jgi:TolA-binding protein
LLDFESVVYAGFNDYNAALALTKENKFVSALEKITCFLTRFPEDVDANRLKFYILKQLKDVEFEGKAENFIKNFHPTESCQL